MILALGPWLLCSLLQFTLFFHGAGQTQALDARSQAVGEPTTRIQVLDGRTSTNGFQLYRVTGLKQGEKLYVYAEATSGNLDPLVALLKADANPKALASESVDQLVKTLSRDHSPIALTREIMDQYALAWNDDYEGHYYPALRVEVPADGDYWLAVGSSLIRPSAGAYRLVVGIDAPHALSGNARSSGPAFVFAEKGLDSPERGIALVTGELSPAHPIRFYYLADLAAGQTFYAYAEAITGGLKPVLTLYDHSDKPVAYANFSAAGSRAALQYALPRKAESYRLKISSQDPAGKATAGNFRLLMGLNTPEVLRGEGEPTGRQILREPIPVRIGVKLQQITEVDQKAENFGVVATLVMHWRDPALAFNPETVENRFKIFEGDAFSAEMSRRGQPWPQYTVVNQ